MEARNETLDDPTLTSLVDGNIQDSGRRESKAPDLEAELGWEAAEGVEGGFGAGFRIEDELKDGFVVFV